LPEYEDATEGKYNEWGCRHLARPPCFVQRGYGSARRRTELDRILPSVLAWPQHDPRQRYSVNAEQLFQEACLLREHKHFSRSLFLHQIAMGECAKVEMIGEAATGLTLGRPVDPDALEKGKPLSGSSKTASLSRSTKLTTKSSSESVSALRTKCSMSEFGTKSSRPQSWRLRARGKCASSLLRRQLQRSSRASASINRRD
jgi:hypothetical protein